MTYLKTHCVKIPSLIPNPPPRLKSYAAIVANTSPRQVDDEEKTVKTSNCRHHRRNDKNTSINPKGHFSEHVNVMTRCQPQNDGWREIFAQKQNPPPRQDNCTTRIQDNKNLPKEIFPTPSGTTHITQHKGGHVGRPSKIKPATSAPPATTITKAQAWKTIIQ